MVEYRPICDGGFIIHPWLLLAILTIKSPMVKQNSASHDKMLRQDKRRECLAFCVLPTRATSASGYLLAWDRLQRESPLWLGGSSSAAAVDPSFRNVLAFWTILKSEGAVAATIQVGHVSTVGVGGGYSCIHCRHFTRTCSIISRSVKRDGSNAMRFSTNSVEGDSKKYMRKCTINATAK